MGVRLHLRFYWRDMAELNKGFFDVIRHRYVDLACGVVPVKREAKVSSAFPINVNLVILLEYADEMFDVVLIGVLYSEVIDNKGEADWAPVMTPVSWGDLALPVPRLLEVFGEEVLGNDAGLGKAVHPTLYFTEDVAICVDLVAESISLDDILGKQFKFHLEVLVAVHGSHEVEVFDVNCHELGIGGGNDAVEHEFDGEEVCGWCSTVIRVID